MYIYGLGVKTDLHKALYYMQKAKKNGYQKADEPIKWLKNQIIE